MTKSSKFTDLRNAVIQSIADLGYETAVNTAAVQAFNAVGIAGGSGGGAGGANYQTSVSPNPGADQIIYTDGGQTKLNLTNPNGTPVTILTNTDILSKPSVSDDGSEIIFVGGDTKIHYIPIDWAAGTFGPEEILSDDAGWKNVALSKDGYRLAGVPSQSVNQIYVYNFETSTWKTFPLYNPTYTDGITTGDVKYADALEWDFSGTHVIYDAYNKITNGSAPVDYWDVGILRAFNGSNGNFGDGKIQKLFSSLPESVSIGNPTFSKNSPSIVAFDYINADQDQYVVVGINIESGATGTIYENSQLGYPNYSRLDNKVIFSAKNTNNQDVLAIAPLSADKINASAAPTIFKNDAKLGVWFANGTRNLTSNNDLAQAELGTVSPNPFTDKINIRIAEGKSDNYRIELYNLLGVSVLSKNLIGYETQLDAANLPEGTYFLHIYTNKNYQVVKVTKIN